MSRINNGRRVAVEHEAYTGQAGMVERGDGRAQLAFFHAKPETSVSQFTGEIKIEGEPWQIVAAQPSRTAPRPPNAMMLLTVRRLTAVSEPGGEA